jgi:hypothetical protein
VAAKAGLDSAAAVTTAEARALERWLERLFIKVSWDVGGEREIT